MVDKKYTEYLEQFVTEKRKALFNVYIADINTGIQIEVKTICDYTLNDWVDQMGKAQVKSTFENEICS